jgi:predicted nucleic acid-binding protein
MIVIDASVVGPALIDDAPSGDRMRERLRGERLTAPALVDVEVLATLKRVARRRGLDERRQRQAITELMTMPLQRVPHLPLLARMWDLRDNLSVYDAAYVALAEAISAPLLTGDAGIAKAPGVRCEVEVLR